MASSGRVRNSAEIGVRKATEGFAELCVVKDVVAFHAELEVTDVVTRQRKVLGDDQIGVIDSRGVVPVPDNVSKGADRFLHEAGGSYRGKALVF